ncbi:hypothetical protein PRJ39_23225 [Lysobacter enzymogenes]|uniref:hypothetical protein n=1 Tax=Lysobacter enzymogenes TaxID=69 RepID=UPI003748B828
MNPEIIRNHALTSKTAVRFLDHSVTQGRCLDQLELLDETLPAFLRDYPYPLNSWPWFVGSEMQQTLRDCVCRVPELVYRAIRAEFANDRQGLAAFYRIPPMLADIFMESGVDMRQLMLRVDAMLTSRGLKILEINTGPDIGGWQIQWLDRQYRKQAALASFFETVDCHSRNIPKEYMKHLIVQGKSYPAAANGRVNILIVVGKESFELGMSAPLVPLFREALDECGVDGEILIERDLANVRFDRSGVHAHGRRICTVVPFHRGSSFELPLELYRASLGGTVYWPGNPLVPVIGDKRSLAIAQKHKDSKLFNDEERDLIERFVPWSVPVAQQTVRFDGVDSDLRELLLARREDFVVKAAQGSSGTDVYVGKFQTDPGWREVVGRAFSEGTWLAQEYCASLPFYGQSGPGGYAVHDVIWGLFGFGGGYGGCWLRLMLKDKGNGVINSAMGATETIVYEVSE